MDKRCSTTVLVDLLELDNEITWITFCVCNDLGTKQCDNVVGDNLYTFVLKISIIDTKVIVEPSDLASNELARDEALDKNNVNSVDDCAVYACLLSDFLLNHGPLLILSAKDEPGVACMILCMV
jgi:hypothetical protein